MDIIYTNIYNMYCGIGKVPKGKKRGTAKECLNANQVRYYGIEQIDEKYLEKKKEKKLDLTTQKLKLLDLQQKGKKLVNDVKVLNIILDADEGEVTEAKIKKAQKKKDALLLQRDKLVKQIAAQKKVIERAREMEAEQKKRDAKKKAPAKKTTKKTTRKRE